MNSNERDFAVLEFIGRWGRGERLVWLEPNGSGCYIGQCAYKRALELGDLRYQEEMDADYIDHQSYPQVRDFDTFFISHQRYICWGCDKPIKDHEHSNAR
jgi:hypothetical protein